MELWELLKLLGDATRLRLLALLAREELSVAELQEVLDMGQSRISSHLGILRQGGLVADRKDGKRAYYSLNPRLRPEARQLIELARNNESGCAEMTEDEANLERLLEKRRRAAERYFNQIAGKLGKKYCPGRSWEAIGHLLLHLAPPIEIADLGAGEGLLSQLLARRAKAVYCIDNSPQMVEVGARLAAENGFDNLFYQLGSLEEPPLADGSVDLALFSQALHHARRPRKAIREAFRILRPAGQVIILDLKEHHFEKARDLYADVWLGFKENVLYRWLKEAGFRNAEVNMVVKEPRPPCFETLLARGVKPRPAETRQGL